jgi:DNA-binding NarL/FixJ family response regulator
MKKPCVLLCGNSVSRDAGLISALQKSAEVISNHDNDSIEAILESKKVEVIILEVPGLHPGEADIIREVKARYPETKIIFIDGGRELMAMAFQYGASDAYRKPYKNGMLVERVETLLGY